MQNDKEQKLYPFSVTMIVTSLVIGMGIFRTASNSANASLHPGIFFLAWIFGGIIALCGALTYAEIGSRYPVTGGYYKVFAMSYHPSLAFALNCVILISNAASLSGVALIGSDYLSGLLFGDTPPSYFKVGISVIAISIFYGVNLLGLKMSSRTQNILMSIKIGMLLIIISALFFPASYAQNNISFDFGAYSLSDSLSSFGAALIAICFTYGGYQQSINFGDEVYDAKRTLPRGIIIGIFIVITLYLLVNFAYYKVVGFEELKQAKGVAAIVAEKLMGGFGKTLFSLLLFFAVLAYVNVLLLANPRVMYAMSKDGILPDVFQQKKGNKEVLFVSLTVFTLIVIIVLFYAQTFDRLLGFVMFLDSIGMATSAAALFFLRKKTKHLDGTDIYSMKWYPIIPLIFILSYLFVTYTIIKNTPNMALTGTLVIIAFLIIYFLIPKKKTISNA